MVSPLIFSGTCLWICYKGKLMDLGRPLFFQDSANKRDGSLIPYRIQWLIEQLNNQVDFLRFHNYLQENMLAKNL